MLSVHFLFDVRGLRGMERGLVCACRNVPVEVRDERCLEALRGWTLRMDEK
jgi:hypothetical protein